MHARSFDFRQCHDASRQLAFKSALVIHLFLEICESEICPVKYLETNAAAIAFSGVVLGLLVNKKFLAIPAIVLPFLFQHAVQGWCPPVPLFRRLGVRTRKEIDAEKYALKAVRGDFDELPPANNGDTLRRARQAWQAANA